MASDFLIKTCDMYFPHTSSYTPTRTSLIHSRYMLITKLNGSLYINYLVNYIFYLPPRCIYSSFCSGSYLPMDPNNLDHRTGRLSSTAVASIG